MEEAKWYVAHTFSGYENKVASNIITVVENRNLHDLIYEVAIPTETVKELKSDGTEKEYQRKLMPGYVFIKMVMTDESWYVVRNIRGCTGFVGPDGEPQPLTDEEVISNNLEHVSVKVEYEQGDLVNVVDGPLVGFSGTVQSIDIENNSVQVLVSMFGRETNVEFELDQLEKVSDQY
ncbi:MAG: transcription termination/antitermination protein NusG [Clostridiales bacterium]|nr:transcription termination/antitermination protein NusG [Clostridiales bacterium]